MFKKTILITGGAGFIGSNFVPYFLKKYSKYRIVNLDKLTYAGNLNNIKEIKHHPNYVFVKGDICAAKLINKIFKKYDIQGVIHFAAESHVDNSISGPLPFIKTNIEGTFILLETAKTIGLKHLLNVRKNIRIVVSTIFQLMKYMDLGSEGFFK
jgi:dTDP-glucose 4,6-dehydratase